MMMAVIDLETDEIFFFRGYVRRWNIIENAIIFSYTTTAKCGKMKKLMWLTI